MVLFVPTMYLCSKISGYLPTLKQRREICRTFISPRANHLTQTYFFQIMFEDVIAEPEGTHSFKPIWLASFSIFTETKIWCYRILSTIIALPCALFWGCMFACFTFTQVWFIVPFLTHLKLLLDCIGLVWKLPVKMCCNPCHDSMSRIFSGFKLDVVHRSSTV
jgi:caveolin 3